MPNRIIKESICTSDTIEELGWFEEVFFYRLIVNCDDFGRMDGRKAILRARMFPLKKIEDGDMEKGLCALEEAGLIWRYTSEGKPYLQIISWDKHQQVRSKRSKFPAPESICNQRIADESGCPRNPIQSESESNLNPKGFDEFWAAYPKKQAKKDAEQAFSKLNPDEALLKTMLTAIEAAKRGGSWQAEGGRYIPHAATWIRGGRWDDEPDKPRKQSNPALQYEQREYTEEELRARVYDPTAEEE